MIIDSLGQTAKTNLKVERAEFGVSADKAKKFLHIAVRNLYSNPVLASIVEVSQNAHDEHVRRGIEKTPFHVTIPTSWTPTFSVRDFGGGIPHDYMLGGYTQALESTKDTNSEMSGGWGLGRMALLSLASTYNVSTYINGHERNYSIFESENGIEILMTHERKTTEPNGTLISAPVPTAKVSQFRDDANRAFRYYKVKPIIKGDSNFKLDEPKFALKGDDWGIEEGGNTTSVVCGIYHYPIQTNNIPNLTPVQQGLLGNIGLVMFFGASDLAPMANRQGLYYNDKTVLAIKNRLNEIETAIAKEAQLKFDACKTHYEAKMLWGKMFCGAVSKINSILRFSDKVIWNGLRIEHNRLEDIHKVIPPLNVGDNNEINCTTLTMNWSRRGYKPRHAHGMTAITIAEKHTIFINDLAGNRGFLNRAKFFLRDKCAKSGNDLALSASVLTFKDDAAKTTFLKHYNLNETDFQKISSVTVVPTSREGASLLRAKTKVFEWTGKSVWNRKNYSDCWTISEIDLEEEEERVYIGIERYAPVGFSNLDDLVSKVDLLKKAKYLPNDFKLYGVRANSDEYTDIQDDDNWTSFQDLIAKFVKEYKIPADEIQILADADHFQSSRYSILFNTLFYYDHNFAAFANIKNKSLFDYFAKVKFMHDQKMKADKNDFNSKHAVFASLGGSIKRDGATPTHDLINEGNALEKSLPILGIVDVDNFNKLNILDNFLCNQK